MRLERTILHINVADFGVAVERVEDGSLRKSALIIAPLGAARSVVYDMSDEAYRSGVRKGMKLNRAVRICKGAKVLPPRFDVYRRAMRTLIGHARHYSPLVEHGVTDGHLFVDVTGTHRLFGPPPDIGWKVRKNVRASLGIDPIWSLGSSKLVAKVASRLVKPLGEYIVGVGEETDFLAPLSVSLLPGLSHHEMRKLQELNLTRVGQLASLNRHQLMVVFGERGRAIYELCRGIDRKAISVVETRDDLICHEHQFSDDTNDRNRVKSVVASLVSRAAITLRKRRLLTRRVEVRVEYSDGVTVARQAVDRRGSFHDDVLLQQALLALKRAWTRRTRLRGCTLVCDRLRKVSPQLQLFPECREGQDKQLKILDAMDRIRWRFGHDAVRSGVTLVG